jgi:AcrR family transcriptional regulator
MSAPERREAILQAARPLFARGGWLGTNTRALAAAAGVTEPILYRHFGDKVGLFLAVLERAANSIAEAVRRHVAGTRGAAARLDGLAKALDEALGERLQDMRILEAAGWETEVEGIYDAARHHLGALADLLASCLKGTGLRRGVDAEAAGGLLLEVGLGAAVLLPLRVEPVTGPRYRASALALLLRALR